MLSYKTSWQLHFVVIFFVPHSRNESPIHRLFSEKSESAVCVHPPVLRSHISTKLLRVKNTQIRRRRKQNVGLIMSVPIRVTEDMYGSKFVVTYSPYKYPRLKLSTSSFIHQVSTSPNKLRKFQPDSTHSLLILNFIFVLR